MTDLLRRTIQSDCCARQRFLGWRTPSLHNSVDHYSYLKASGRLRFDPTTRTTAAHSSMTQSTTMPDINPEYRSISIIFAFCSILRCQGSQPLALLERVISFCLCVRFAKNGCIVTRNRVNGINQHWWQISCPSSSPSCPSFSSFRRRHSSCLSSSSLSCRHLC